MKSQLSGLFPETVLSALYGLFVATVKDGFVVSLFSTEEVIPFRTVVSRQDYGIQMPVRTAYRYINQVAALHNLSAKVVARVEAAGYDPAATRVAKAVRKLGNKVNKLTSTDLASALKKKGHGKKAHTHSPEQQLQAAFKAAVERYIRATCDDETTVAQAVERALEYMDGRKIRVNHGLTLVGKAA